MAEREFGTSARRCVLDVLVYMVCYKLKVLIKFKFVELMLVVLCLLCGEFKEVEFVGEDDFEDEDEVYI